MTLKLLIDGRSDFTTTMVRWIVWIVENPSLLLALTAGTVFGLWPYFLDRAGLQKFDAPAAFCQIQAIFLLFFLTFYRVRASGWQWLLYIAPLIMVMGYYAYILWEVKTVAWNKLLIASLLSSIGLLSMTVLMQIWTKETRSTLLAVMNITSLFVYMAVFWWNHPGEFGWGRRMGFVFAGASVVCLMKKW
jgi:hypothetical protein